jgi:acetyltransferase-like isoleucine patch superfamily enzyme
MDEFSVWRFVIFACAFAAMIYLQFYLAHREWMKVKGEQASEIDVGYVRTENYMAQSFRMKVAGWLQLPAQPDQRGGNFIIKGRERIHASGALEIGAGESSDDIKVVNGDFICGPDCNLTRELYIRGNATIGPRAKLQALASDGLLTLGEGGNIARWVDASGDLTIGAGCQIGARATSLKRVWLGSGSQVASAFAPEVVSSGWNGEFPSDEASPDSALEIVFPEESRPPDSSLAEAGLDPKKFYQLSPDCWLYKGDFKPLVAVRVTRKLVVRGDCWFREASVIESDIKASGMLSVGALSVCRGNLISDGHLEVGRACRFSGLVHAGKSLLLSAGACGVGSRGLVAVFGEDHAFLEHGVAIRGKIASRGRVKVLDAQEADAWRSRTGGPQSS